MRKVGEVLVIGGGLAGLAAGRALGERAHLVEASDRLGGLARTETVDGFAFDWTGHWLHLRTARWRAEAARLISGGLLTVERQARIYSHGVWTPFPFQVNTFGLPPDVVSECLQGFIAATVGPEGEELRASEPRTFREFVLRYLGAGIARHFMEPYNRKLYCVDTAELSAEWGGRFVPRPTLAEVVDGAVGRVREGLGYNATFVYPREGGIEALARALAAELTCGVSLGARVERVRTAEHRVRLSDGREIGYDQIISTMPLKALCAALDPRPDAVRAAAAALRSVSVTTVELGVKGPPRVPFHWVYVPEERFPFYRVGSPSQVNRALAPPGHTSYAVEHSHFGPPPDPTRTIDAAVRGLESMGVLKLSDVVLARTRTIPTAYVVVDHAYAEARRTIVEHLAAEGVELAGRYGLWEYSGMEDALLSGESAAERVLKLRAPEAA